MYSWVLFIYVGVILAIGFGTARYVKTLEDFALAGRNLSFPVLLGTLFASYVGGATVIGWTGSFYSLGIDWWFTAAGALLGVAAAAFIMSERCRRLEQYTVPDLLELRYDAKTRVIGSLMIILGDVSLIAVQTISIAGVLTAYFGWERIPAMIFATVVFMAIALVGGMIGVAITDAVQAVIIAAGLMVGVGAAFSHAGGFTAMLSSLPPGFLSPLSNLAPRLAFNNAIAVFGTVAVWQSIIFSRVFAAKDVKTAKRGVVWLIPAGFLAYFLVAMLGYSARVILGPGVPAGSVFAKLVTEVLSPGVAVVLLAVVIGAIITTVNSILLSVSVNFTRDLYQKLFRKNADSKELLFVGRASVLVVSLLAFLLAAAMPDIVSAIVFTYTMYSAALLVPLYGGYLWKRATAAAGLLGVISGAGTALTWYLLKNPLGLPPMIPSIIISLVVFVVASLLTPEPSKEQLKVFDV
ncbi:MAG: sodium:solute symporter family protein [Bacillota bacterium]